MPLPLMLNLSSTGWVINRPLITKTHTNALRKEMKRELGAGGNTQSRPITNDHWETGKVVTGLDP
jgi:hypothetical protein